MKSVKLYYNATAGEGVHSKAGLIRQIRDAGYRVTGASSKSTSVRDAGEDADVLVVAGGDGTVRKACLDLLHMPIKQSRPIGLLALGTANNIALTLKISKYVGQVIRSWSRHRLKRFDVGRIDGPKGSDFFIEAFGFGLFPGLMRRMERLLAAVELSAADELSQALKLLAAMVQNYEAARCKVMLDDREYEGKYIMAEVMNIRSLGPRLVLAPGADPGDGRFDVLLVSERQRARLLAYLEKLAQGIRARFPFRTIKARRITIRWEGNDMHIDDQLNRKYVPVTYKVSLLDGMLDFLVQR